MLPLPPLGALLLVALLLAVPAAPALQAQTLPSDLALWLRADAGVVTSADGLVERWTDASGQDNDAVAPDANARPRLAAGTLNGRPVVAFDGASDFLTVADAPELRPQHMTLFVVAMMDGELRANGDGQGPFLVKVSDTNWNDGYGLARYDAGHKHDVEFFVEDYVNGHALLPLPFDAYTLYTGVYDGSAVRLAVDGSPFATTPDVGNVPSTGPLFLGTGPADNHGGRPFLEGGIAEVLLFDRALSAAERLVVEQYLADKYALQTRPVPTDGLALWLRADRGVVTLDESAERVYAWGDYSGQGNAAYDLIGAVEHGPMWTMVDGLPAIRFSQDAFLAAHDAESLNPEEMTLFVVGLADGSAGRFSPFVAKTSDFGWTDGYGLAVFKEVDADPNLGVGFFVTDRTQHLVSGSVAPNRLALYTGRFAADSVQLRINRERVGTVPFAGAPGPTSEPLYIGASSGGADADPRQFLDGAVAEVLLYGRALTEAEQAEVEAYLSAKYRLPNPTVSTEGPDVLPEGFTLSAAYPNPFNPEARFTLTLVQAQPVRVELFDALGRRVALFHEGMLTPGTPHTFAIDGRGLPSGTYLYRATGTLFSTARAVTLLK